MWRLNKQVDEQGNLDSSFLKRPYPYFLRKIKRGRVFLILACFFTLLFTLDRLYPLPLDRIKNHSFILLDKDQKLVSVLLSKDQAWRIPPDLSSLSPLFLRYLIAFEDKRFYQHIGVDPLALVRACLSSLRQGKIVSGGSTITMQVAKLIEPKPRTFINKLREILRALQLEWHYQKHEILTFYLTLAPYGGNLEGVQAASLAYFAKLPIHLNPSEAAFLVSLPQHPAWATHADKSTLLKAQRDKVLSRMRSHGLSQKAFDEAIQDPIPIKKTSFPASAYHLSHRLRVSTQEAIFQTTLDLQMQTHLEHLLKTEIFEQGQLSAALVVDNQTHQVRAYVGSSEPTNRRKQGFVDMIPAIRSPGSTLKPFIYAYAFDDGWLSAYDRLADVPYAFGKYTPTNFKDHFRGVVTAREALQLSLNVPVVWVMDQIGPQAFTHWLENFGVHFKLPSSYLNPSLAIALGGVGISLWDLVTLYTALANKGEFKPLTYCQKDAPSGEIKPRYFLSKKTAQEIKIILRSAAPPPAYAPKGVDKTSPIAYKTGTSYGHRDAWCFGYTDRYTIAVWVGKADGSPVPSQMGRLEAAPLLFKAFALVEPEIFRKPEEEEISGHLILPQKKSKEPPFMLTYPAPDSQVLCTEQPLVFSLQGGQGPYTWLLNGKRITTSNGPTTLWHIPGAGFYTLTVIDKKGETVSSYFRGMTPQQVTP